MKRTKGSYPIERKGLRATGGVKWELKGGGAEAKLAVEFCLFGLQLSSYDVE